MAKHRITKIGGDGSRVNFSILTRIIGPKYIDDHCEHDPQNTLVSEDYVTINWGIGTTSVALDYGYITICVCGGYGNRLEDELDIPLADPQLSEKVNRAIETSFKFLQKGRPMTCELEG
jgi:hypothetical protein